MPKSLLGLLLFIIATAVGGFPQNTEGIVRSSQVPLELQGSLVSRLNLFLNAQAEGQWDHISALLGSFRTAFVRDIPYTAAHRACLISAMKARPMVEFNLKEVRDSPFSSMFIRIPAGRERLARRSWVLVGEGLFRGDSATVKKPTSVVAYRDQEEWYFTPAPVDNIELTRDELLRERKDDVQLLVPADCPLEVVDLHVVIDPKHVGSRQVHFRLRNRTSKPIARYGFKMDDERQDGSIEFGSGKGLEPGGITDEFNEDYVLYSFWRCEGEPPIRIQIDHVGFAEGTEWQPPESTSAEGKMK